LKNKGKYLRLSARKWHTNISHALYKIHSSQDIGSAAVNHKTISLKQSLKLRVSQTNNDKQFGCWWKKSFCCRCYTLPVLPTHMHEH